MNIYRSNADGTSPLQLTPSGTGLNSSAKINATQTKVLFISNRTGKYQVYSMGVDGSSLAQLTTTGVTGGQNNGGSGAVSWTPDGKILYINGTKIYKMNDDGTGATAIATAPSDYWSDIRCSPTGNKIAAQTQNGWAYIMSIYIMNLDGSSMTKLIPDDPGGQSLGSFSKDGSQLYYCYDIDGHEESSGLSTNSQIYSIKIDGTAKTKISVGKPAGYNDIAPVIAGSKMYFIVQQAINGATGSEIWRMNLDGMLREKVISGGYNYYPEMVEVGSNVLSVFENSLLPTNFILCQNFPNPFNPSTTIRFATPLQAHVSLTVFNSLGQQVSELVNCEMNAGNHTVVFDAMGLASGMYFYRLHSDNFVETKKLLLLR